MSIISMPIGDVPAEKPGLDGKKSVDHLGRCQSAG